MGTKSFKRDILRVQSETLNSQVLDITTRLAVNLELDLLGLFLKDHKLETALQYPWAREFRSHSKEWRDLSREEVQREQNLIMEGNKKRFLEKAQEKKSLVPCTLPLSL